jgi:S1-C subfamily serine protease
VAEVVVYKGSDGRTGIVFADGRGPAVVAFLRAALPVASSESLFCGDRVISVNGRPVHSGREAVKAIKSAPGNRVSLSVDARGAETETRVVDRGGHSSIGLAVCNADPLHTLQSDEAGQVTPRPRMSFC